VAATLLAKGWLPRSFASFDPIAEVPASAARREVLKEFAFLAPPAVGAALGAIALGERAMPPTLAALSTALLGMLVAAGAIWLTRIFGTLAFGREAMGLGDVHLMAAAGAVIGWRDGLLVYLAAPFIALAWVAVSGGLARMRGRAARELPYGPHLAMACVVVFLGRPWLVPLARSAFGVG
jgi:leader peptidase (prepilin peptidase)/N-methyltransferase